LAQEDALAELERCAGTQFDPSVVAALAEELQPAVPELVEALAS
jgi:HD-GYP domain-containing protein (c-di-GMP phosphodiesterase class II)